MYKFNITAGIAVLLLICSGCSDYLDKPEPAQSLPSAGAFSTVADLQTALIGSYNALQNSDYGSTGLAINSSILSDNAEWRGSFPSYIELYDREITASNPEITGFWEFSYEAINQANLVLNAVETLDDPAATPDIINQLRGEALFIRGLTYFELTRAFGKPFGASSGSDLGVPVLTSPTFESGDLSFPARATVQAGYDQAISDLTEAQSLLDPMGTYGFANGTAATAILADIAFQQRDYPRAAELAGTVIDAGYMLAPTPEVPFTTEGSAEEIFAVVNTTQDNPGVNGSLATFHHINGRGGDVVVNEDLKENGFEAVVSADQLTEAGADTIIDLRAENLTSNGIFNVEKYEDFGNNGDDNILVRLATYYLMRAEALARTEGVNEESIELLNDIRTRSLRVRNSDGDDSDASDIVSYEEDDFDNADALIEAIILERRVELAFENNRLNDLRRLMRNVRGLPFDSDRLVFPIPQFDLDANDQLIQNPGY